MKTQDKCNIKSAILLKNIYKTVEKFILTDIYKMNSITIYNERSLCKKEKIFLFWIFRQKTSGLPYRFYHSHCLRKTDLSAFGKNVFQKHESL